MRGASMKSVGRLLAVSCLTVAGLGAGTSALAASGTGAPAILLPGGSVSLPDFPDGVALVATKTSSFGGGPGPAGVLTEYVVTDSTVNPFGYNGLVFAFSLSLSSGDVAQIALPGYAPFDTAVKSCNNTVCIEGLGTPPDTATRSSDGDVVSFLWGTPITTTSAGFSVYTNATGYIDPPSGKIIDAAGDVSLVSVFLPSAVPEPASWTLMLLGIALLGPVIRGKANVTGRRASS